MAVLGGVANLEVLRLVGNVLRSKDVLLRDNLNASKQKKHYTAAAEPSKDFDCGGTPPHLRLELHDAVFVSDVAVEFVINILGRNLFARFAVLQRRLSFTRFVRYWNSIDTTVRNCWNLPAQADFICRPVAARYRHELRAIARESLCFAGKKLQ